ncbi:MAG TPA: ProQ/FINO family protein [Candidatus Accumulibacter phosphatis]|nr:MAG: ProP effector [Candidatus Accumulibacter sp. SK-11]HAY27291.1 osmoprotectant transporter activator [Accumulibacter sp.]HRL76442.1 ProQ/FINO family protein [Candidatus Accumulibacter phosphatis]HCN67475.1 osmoprotectant transporter activator [Accumulibacter sp.]HCV13924.1 osmoprotectant transporter activator [Accumulibacter sp.]
MTMPTPNPVPEHNPRQLLKELQARFPIFRDSQPLAIGIDKQLLTRVPGLDRKTLRIALAMHTHSLRYLKTMAGATGRFDLDGQAAGEVTETHRSHATELVRERLQKQVEERKAQREAEAQARRHTEKLGRLVDKFGRNR